MKNLLLIPTILFPYTVCLGFTGRFNESLSNTAIALHIAVSLITLLSALLCNLLFIFATKNTSTTQLLKTALIIKAIHIPAYLIIFVSGAIMGLLFFFTIPIIAFLVLIDFITLCLSGMISVYAHIKALKEKNTELSVPLIISLICQAFFCADVISLLVVSITLKKSKG